MLNPFPDLFFLGAFLSPLLLRVALGIYLINSHQSALKNATDTKKRVMAGLYVVAGLMCIVGFLTQIAALGIIVLSTVTLILKISRKEMLDRNELWLTVFVMVIACALLFSGAGGLAIDIPL